MRLNNRLSTGIRHLPFGTLPFWGCCKTGGGAKLTKKGFIANCLTPRIIQHPAVVYMGALQEVPKGGAARRAVAAVPRTEHCPDQAVTTIPVILLYSHLHHFNAILNHQSTRFVSTFIWFGTWHGGCLLEAGSLDVGLKTIRAHFIKEMDVRFMNRSVLASLDWLNLTNWPVADSLVDSYATSQDRAGRSVLRVNLSVPFFCIGNLGFQTSPLKWYLPSCRN